MYKIVTEHGLVPVPLDITVETMEPVGVAAMKSLITDKTKCVIFAYLFGIIYDINPYLEVLNPLGIDAIEDVA